jgi:hypothetical protein
MVMRRKKELDLHPSEWNEDWQPPIGNDALPGEKPHIWQEFKRDQNMRRKNGEPIIGRGWPIFVGIVILFLFQYWSATGGGPEWLLAIKNIF